MAEAAPIGRNASVEEEKDLAVELISHDLKWSQRNFPLKTLMNKLITPQPILITEGHYEEWGPNTPATPDQYPMLFALGRRFRSKILAQCMVISPGGKHPIGPKFEIDEDYDGWFEILSEDGNPMFRIQNVTDLANHPHKTFALMKSMHVFKYDDSAGDFERCSLDVGDEIVVSSSTSPDCMPGLLKCFASLRGIVVYLPVDAVGSFSLVGEGYLAGPKRVLSLGSLRFPVNVKVLEGSDLPKGCRYHLPTMKLLGREVEEVLTAWPMQKDVPLVHIPANTPMRVEILRNLADVKKLPIYDEILSRIHTLLPKGHIRGSFYISIDIKNIDPEQVGDEQQSLCSHASPVRLLPQYIDFQQTSSLGSSRIKTIELKDNLQTFELSAAYAEARSGSKRPGGGFQTSSLLHRYPLIKATKGNSTNLPNLSKKLIIINKCLLKKLFGVIIPRESKSPAERKTIKRRQSSLVRPLETESSSERDD